METRMERYAKYRAQIKRMAPEQFAPKGEAAPAESEGETPANLSLTAEVSAEDGKGFSAPYMLYLRRRRRFFVVKVILLALAVAGFITWWVLMQGRK